VRKLRRRERGAASNAYRCSSSIGNCPIPSLEVCPPTYYRSYSGLCNNVAQPEWGTSHTALSRILKPVYADGFHPTVTSLFPHWMQFISSDMLNMVETQALIDGEESSVCLQASIYTRAYPGSMSYLTVASSNGSSPERAKQMRSFSQGLLRTYSSAGELPQVDSTIKCQIEGRCMLSGSDDANILPGVTALHAVFIKQHNRIARLLKEQNRHWPDSRLFEEARRVVSAQLQHITYNEFLPIMLGRENIKLVFNNPSKLYEVRGVESILRHLLSTTIAKPALRVNDEVKDEFLKDQYLLGLDLIAIALKRGRDHGVPGYTAVRAQCGLGKVRSFHELKEYFIDDPKVEYINTIYENVDDIDLLVGVLAEQPIKGALFGPTMACITGSSSNGHDEVIDSGMRTISHSRASTRNN
ncbi:heme peroxidase, partial [Ostertagia ostertagi]